MLCHPSQQPRGPNRIAWTVKDRESMNMSVTYVSFVKANMENTKQQKKTKIRIGSDEPSKGIERRFPSVDSVLCDIDAKWEKLTLAS